MSNITVIVQNCGMTGLAAIKKDVVLAFVVFDQAEDKELVCNAYRRSRWFLGRMRQKKTLQFAGAKIKVATAAEPSDVLWTNLDFPHKLAHGMQVRRCAG